jgi:prepilin-type N-terminal cleavage/methylation domain-containing protein
MNAKGSFTAQRGFTLIELLIVIGLLGALTMLILPTHRLQKAAANEDLMLGEMAELQQAFQRFHADCLPTLSDLAVLTNVYLAPLLVQADPNTPPLFDFPDYDLDRRVGWRGPYAETEGLYSDWPAVFDPYGEPYVVAFDGTNNFFLVTHSNTTTRLGNELRRALTFR